MLHNIRSFLRMLCIVFTSKEKGKNSMIPMSIFEQAKYLRRGPEQGRYPKGIFVKAHTNLDAALKIRVSVYLIVKVFAALLCLHSHQFHMMDV